MMGKDKEFSLQINGKPAQFTQQLVGKVIADIANSADHEAISLPEFLGILEGVKRDLLWNTMKKPRKETFEKHKGNSTANGKIAAKNPETLDIMIRAVMWESKKTVPVNQLIGVIEMLKSDTLIANAEDARRAEHAQNAHGAMYG